MKILIVDDSVVFRMSISEALKNVSGIEIIGTASNGQNALDFIQKHGAPDLITLDMEMPVMDGITTIENIRKTNKKIVIIVFSSVTIKGAELTLKALRLGANDFVTKQEASSTVNMVESLKMIESILVPKIKAFEHVIQKSNLLESSVVNAEKTKPSTLNTVRINKQSYSTNDIEKEIIKYPSLLLIASSTGGPEALTTIIKGINVKPLIPILIVQHMPPIFTEKLAQMLNNQTDLVEIREAKGSESLEPGVCYIAPGDYHMTLNEDLTLKLHQEDKVSHVRPSATVLFNSVAKNYKGKTITFVLTGMGDDGASGVSGLVERNDYLYIQDEKSSVVWGMPGSIKQKYPETKEIALLEISKVLNKIFSYSRYK